VTEKEFRRLEALVEALLEHMDAVPMEQSCKKCDGSGEEFFGTCTICKGAGVTFIFTRKL
jgi:DnaJ-class molecular chaperone